MSWKSFACLAAVAALASPAVAQPAIGLRDNGDDSATLTITTDDTGSLGTEITISFDGGIALDGTPTVSPFGTDAMNSSIILNTDGLGIDDNPFPDSPLDNLGVNVVDGSILSSLGVGDQGIREFDLLTFSFTGEGTVTASGNVAQNSVNNPGLFAELVIGGVVLGDANGDGAANTLDIDAFVLALLNPAQYAIDFAAVNPLNTDTNEDGSVNTLDIDSFVDILLGPSTSLAAVPEPSVSILVCSALAGVIGRQRRVRS